MVVLGGGTKCSRLEPLGSWVCKEMFFQDLVLGAWSLSDVEEVSEPELATQSSNRNKILSNFRFAFWGPLFNPVRVLLRQKCPELNNQVIKALTS